MKCSLRSLVRSRAEGDEVVAGTTAEVCARLKEYVKRALNARARDIGVDISDILEGAADAASELFLMVICCSLTKPRGEEQAKPFKINTEVLEDVIDYIFSRLEGAEEDTVRLLKDITEELKERVLKSCRRVIIGEEVLEWLP